MNVGLTRGWTCETTFRGGSSYRFERGGLRMVILNNHLSHPGVWVLRSATLRSADLVVLEAKDAESAKVEAIMYMRRTLSAMLRAIGGKC